MDGSSIGYYKPYGFGKGLDKQNWFVKKCGIKTVVIGVYPLR
jgi:hypothetical protein